MENKEAYLGAAEAAIASALKLGARLAEAYICNSKELKIEVREGRVETMKLAANRGLGLRVVSDQRTGFSFSTNLSPPGVKEAAEQALANCRITAPDPYLQLPPPGDFYPNLDIYDPSIGEAAIEQKIDLAKSMEDAAKSFDPRVKIIESSTYLDEEEEVTIVSNLGLKLSYRGAYCGVYLALTAEEGGDSQTGFALDLNLKYQALKPEEVGREAAGRAVRMLGAGPVTTRKVAVVLDPYVATGFLGLISPSLTAEAVQKGRSLFAGKTGTKVASDLITIIDDGTLPGGVASAPFDGEGVTTSRTPLIEGGVLHGYLHNTYTAAKDGVRSTGNGVRNSFKGTPEVGVTNIFIEPGPTRAARLLAETDCGIYITEVMGMHTANPISGDFSVGVAGLLIEKGCLTRPVRGMALGGNIREFLTGVEAVGDDLRFYGGRGSPTLKISEMTLGGQ